MQRVKWWVRRALSRRSLSDVGSWVVSELLWKGSWKQQCGVGPLADLYGRTGTMPCGSKRAAGPPQARGPNPTLHDLEYFKLTHYPNLNCCLLIFKALIRVSRVEGGIRSLAAAPDGPETRPLVSASAASIISRSDRASTFKAGDVSSRDACGEVLLESHNSSTEKTSVELRMMDLSITFCSSRMLPGQS